MENLYEKDSLNIGEPEVAVNGVNGENGENAENGFNKLVALEKHNGDLPVFPVDAFPIKIANYVKAVAAHSQTSEDMAATMALGVLAVSLQGKFQVESSSGHYEPLSLYTVVIAAPGERKSSVMTEMTKCLYEYEKNYNEAHKDEIRANKQERNKLELQIFQLKEKLKVKQDESIERKLIDLEDELYELPELKPARFIADDCSSEALVSLLANNNGHFAVISSEGGIFDIMSGRYSAKANFEVWLKGHCGDTIMIDRKGRESEVVLNPHLSAILAIQPCVLEEIMSDEKMGGKGLIARLMFSSPKSLIGKRKFGGPEIPDKVKREYTELINKLMDCPLKEEPITLKLSSEAEEIMNDYFAEHEIFLSGEGQIIAEWASKYIGAVLRIAGLIHVADETDSSVITEETILRAISIGKYFLAHSQYAYSLMGNDNSLRLAKFVLGKIKNNKIERIKRADLTKMCRNRNIKKVEDLMPIVDLLEEYGYLRKEMPEQRAGSGRKPGMVIVVNPAIYDNGVNGE